ncbi:transcriptional regulator DEF1 [Zerene cesonia]|uniref:transcriptional regulator DEF1 n=1 Tax=Zerene cesonia TaxID=33412 RepID=UPI0018E57449|nr:transcriptional regulator DEF1 [Zerene cesonia]
MRWITLILCCTLVSIAIADPDPKKYKPEAVEKDKKTGALSDDERKFLREVEEKFGVKSDVPSVKKGDVEIKEDEKSSNDTKPVEQKLTFPAVIAIEIVNDTDSKYKGKRTIDANLGYGYKTNNGYTYSYFGKSAQDKGKFMIYPYSQEDIPGHQTIYNSDYMQVGSKYQKTTTNVEIQPSQAYELVPVKDEHPSYDYKKPEIEFKTPSPLTSQKSNESPSSTLYTTYNGQEFSGLSAQFPTLMPNYFVNPSQLLTNPQYQNAGLTQDVIRSHQSQLGQRIVPVLVLRIPSSSIKNPSAELYANLPNNYPLSSYLNNVNLQQLVNQYFKKHGYSFAPQIMAYQNSPVAQTESEPQHYANPYVKPSYTQADYSGVQYSAVKPVMARYPSRYNQPKYFVAQPQSLYRQPTQQQYEYQYQYVPQMAGPSQDHYVQPQYQQPEHIQQYQTLHTTVQQGENVPESYNVEYKSPAASQEALPATYDTPNVEQQSSIQPNPSYYSSADVESQYEEESENAAYSKEAVQSNYDHGKTIPTSYTSSSSSQKDTGVSVIPSRLIHTEQYEESSGVSPGQDVYSYQSHAAAGQSPKGFALSENYPSKDHTIATVFPYPYNAPQKPKPSVQTVSYVTPMPSAKYQSQYKIMVPQTVFKSPNSEKISYVNSSPMHYLQAGRYTQDVNPEEEYSVSSQYVPVASKPSYSRNYHSLPKRMSKPDNKMESSVKVAVKKQGARSETKKSS